MPETVAEVIGRRVHGLRWADLGDPVRERVQRLLLANVSVALAGTRYAMLPRPPQSVAGHAVLGGGWTTEATAAARFNAAAMHARTQDDFSRSHSGGHVGTCVIPAALIAAERYGATGQEFLEALAAGYMTQVGVARSSVKATMKRGFRSVSLYGPFGATAAVAKLYGFDAARTANAVSLVASTAAGLGQCWIDGSDEWQVHPGQVAVNALYAADLTAAGVRGAPRAFDGSAGFYSAYAGTTVTPTQIDQDLDAPAAIADVTVKRYPVSGICQPVVETCERLAESGVEAPDIAGVLIRMHPGEAGYPGTSVRPPFGSVSGALMSAAYCAAAVFVRGSLALADLYDHVDPRRAELAGRIEVVAAPDRPYLRPLVRVTMRDGRFFEDSADGETADSDDGRENDWIARLWADTDRPSVPLPALREQIARLPEASSLDDFLSTVALAAQPTDQAGIRS